MTGLVPQGKVISTSAPPLTEKKLAEYRSLIEALPKKTTLRKTLDRVYAFVSKWWEIDESTGEPVGEMMGKPVIQLDQVARSALGPVKITLNDLPDVNRVLEGIPSVESKDLRNAAYHLLWFTTELARGREPLTR